MKTITKSSLKKQIAENNTRSVLATIIYISEDEGLSKINESSIANLNRYNKWFFDDTSGIKNPQERNEIVVSTLRLIESLPDKNFANPFPQITRSVFTWKKNRRKYIIGILTSSLLLIGLLLYIVFPKDPLGIVGKWEYKVTSKTGQKLLGMDTAGKEFKPRYDYFTGELEIFPIGYDQFEYSISGERKVKWADGKNELDIPDSLGFSEISHMQINNLKSLFFRFNAKDKEKNMGYVKVEVSPNGKEMSGDIHYLYGDNNWRVESVKFKK